MITDMPKGGKREGAGRKPVEVKSPRVAITLRGRDAELWLAADEEKRKAAKEAFRQALNN